MKNLIITIICLTFITTIPVPSSHASVVSMEKGKSEKTMRSSTHMKSKTQDSKKTTDAKVSKTSDVSGKQSKTPSTSDRFNGIEGETPTKTNKARTDIFSSPMSQRLKNSMKSHISSLREVFPPDQGVDRKTNLQKYAEFFITNFSDNPEGILCSLYPNIKRDKLSIDVKKAYEQLCGKRNRHENKAIAMAYYSMTDLGQLSHQELDYAIKPILEFVFDDKVADINITQPPPPPPPPPPKQQQRIETIEGISSTVIAIEDNITARQSLAPQMLTSKPMTIALTDPAFKVALELHPDHPKLSNNNPTPYLFKLDKIAGETSPYLIFQQNNAKEEHNVWINTEHPDLTQAQLDGTEDIPITIHVTGVLDGYEAGHATIQDNVRIGTFKTVNVPFAWRDHDNIPHPGGICPSGNPDPYDFEHLPQLCPRLTYDSTKNKHIYDATGDPFQYPAPLFYKQQPDFFAPQTSQNQNAIAQHFDRCNALTIKNVSVKFDYGDPELKIGHVNCGTGLGERCDGTSSNFYYIVVPCSNQLIGLTYEHIHPQYDTLPDETLYRQKIQPLLHIIQGDLDDPYDDWYINEGLFTGEFLDLYPGQNFDRPSHRIQSFLPSPYAGETAPETLLNNADYTKCEWMDTFSQAPLQELDYVNLAIWDWDIPIAAHEIPECVLVFIIEGDDGEDFYNALGLLDHPTDMTDDLVAAFMIYRNQTVGGQTLYRSNNKHMPSSQTPVDNTNWDFQALFETEEQCLP